jgi:hypothetical protein
MNGLDVDYEEKIHENLNKNPLGFHQTEIIALLALDLLSVSQNIINPVTDEPFKIKFGKIIEEFPKCNELFCRFSLWHGSRWNCGKQKFSILFIW